MSKLKIIPLGGMGRVTQNMYVYEYESEILIVDCGIGFPDVYMPGVDTIIPDISYLLNELKAGKKIVGMVLSHGHEDHIGALPYLSADMPEFPIYASALTAGFAENRMQDKGVSRKVNVLGDKQKLQLGKHFGVTLVAMTHSVPDTKHVVIDTPQGVIYHGSDFKLDPSPVDGVVSDLEMVKEIGEKGVLLGMVDCLRIERPERVPSESKVGPVLEKIMASTRGKYIITVMSSHIHRIQQIVDSAEKLSRKVVFVGRSVEQNVKIALDLKKLFIPKGVMIDKRDINDFADNKLCIVIAGSQGQEGSSLTRAVYGEHREIQIGPNDKVVFSADAIPGNEVPYYKAIDELSRNGVKVIYPTIEPGVHQSGHASALEQEELLKLLKPKFIMPIGGADRHRAQFDEIMGINLGYDEHHIVLPDDGQILGFENGDYQVVEEIVLKPKTVDGLGIGDVGPIVLSDRLSLAQAGIIVLVLPRERGQFDLKNMAVISRGFVFMKQADEVVAFIKEKTAEIISKAGKKVKDEELRKIIEKRLARRLYKVIKREPMIVPVFMDR